MYRNHFGDILRKSFCGGKFFKNNGISGIALKHSEIGISCRFFQ